MTPDHAEPCPRLVLTPRSDEVIAGLTASVFMINLIRVEKSEGVHEGHGMEK